MVQIPLYVDLDGTLVFNNTVYDTIFQLLHKKPTYLLCFPFWLIRGHAYFKRQVAQRIDFDPALLPYHQEMIDFIKQERKQGRKTILMTASDQLIADKVAAYLGIFDEAIGSDAIHSYAGEKKRQKILSHAESEKFDYAGNSSVDLKVWPSSDKVILVSDSQDLLKKAKKLQKPLIHFQGLSRGVNDWIHLFSYRINWLSLFCFIPLMNPRWQSLSALLCCMAATVSMLGMGTASLLFCRLFRHASTRASLDKTVCPIANGKIESIHAFHAAIAMLFVSSLLAFLVSPLFLLFMLGYFFLLQWVKSVV